MRKFAFKGINITLVGNILFFEARNEEEDADEEERSVGGYLGMQKIVPTEELPPLPPLDMPPAFNFGPNNVSAAVAAGTESPAPTSIRYDHYATHGVRTSQGNVTLAVDNCDSDHTL